MPSTPPEGRSPVALQSKPVAAAVIQLVIFVTMPGERGKKGGGLSARLLNARERFLSLWIEDIADTV
jgi:hypothetical protein